jgi:UvrD/REP helicase N-terminal domain
VPAFSRRAAAEMAWRVERIARRVISDNAGVMTDALWAGTFHGIGARLLRDYAGEIGLDPAFTIHDREDSADLIERPARRVISDNAGVMTDALWAGAAGKPDLAGVTVILGHGAGADQSSDFMTRFATGEHGLADPSMFTRFVCQSHNKPLLLSRSQTPCASSARR